MVHRDLVAVIRQLRDVFADIVGKRKFALLDQEQDRRGDKLLSDRSGVEDRVRADRNIALEVGQAVSAVHDDLSVLRGGDRAAGLVRLGPAEDLVDLAGLVLRVGGCAGKQGGDYERYCKEKVTILLLVLSISFNTFPAVPTEVIGRTLGTSEICLCILKTVIFPS